MCLGGGRRGEPARVFIYVVSITLQLFMFFIADHNGQTSGLNLNEGKQIRVTQPHFFVQKVGHSLKGDAVVTSRWSL